MNGKKIQKILETLYPTSTAEKWDNVGLQVGTMNKNITGILISLDLTIDVIEEAIKNDLNLILCHHPALFNPLKTIDTDTYLGKMLQTLIKNDITLYVMHTNFDVSRYGMNMILGKKIGLTNMSFFDIIDEDSGLGVIGTIKRKRADDLIADIKLEFGLETLRYIGNLTDTIEKVAMIGGSGSSYIYQAIESDVDLFITGDVTYHKALDAKNLGLNVLDVGHYFESHGIQELKQVLISKGITLPIKTSNINTNPYKKV
jgi:dinuclear metal center YbgI/SA1388 family protein